MKEDIDLRCPISLKIMKDPVKTINNFTYERKNIEKWFSKEKNIEPMTGEIIIDFTLVPNLDIMNKIIKRNTCLNCNTFLKKSKKYSKCNACYCNKNCQINHWENHKLNFF